jgi:hypothetical protein
MITYEMIKDVFDLDNPLTLEYFELCSTPYEGNEYSEKHHILPKSMFPDFVKCKWNLVRLTAKQHYMAHYYLKDIVLSDENKSKMLQAWVVVCKFTRFQDSIENHAYQYAKAKEEQALRLSGKGNPMYGKKRPQYVIDALTEGARNRVWTEEDKMKMSSRVSGKGNPMYGKTHTPEVREILRKAQTGRPVTDEYRERMSSVTKGENNGMYGKTHKEETIKKMMDVKASYEHKGSMYSLNTLAKMYGISDVGLKHRLKSGMNLDDALLLPVVRGGILEDRLHDLGFVFNSGKWYNAKDGEGILDEYVKIKRYHVVGAATGKTKLDDEKVTTIKKMLANGCRYKDIMNMFGVSKGCVNHIANGRTWTHVIV